MDQFSFLKFSFLKFRFPKGVTGIGVVTGIEILSEFSNDKDDHPLTIFERFRYTFI